jgi:hypothetical protein
MTSQLNSLLRGLLIIHLLSFCGSCAESPNSQKQNAPREVAALPPQQNAPRETAALPPPDGWEPYPNPAPGSAALQCANYSRREWRVTLDGHGVKIDLDTLSNHQEPLPSNIQSRSVAVGTKGTRHIAQADDGSLIGLDVGEFGGGLWWFSSDGQNSRKLSDENVLGFAKTASGILAIGGLAHMGSDYGQILRVGAGAGGNRRIETLSNLDAAPMAFVVESPDSILVLTTRELVRVRGDGTLQHLFPVNYASLYPNSMTLGPAGILHVGMRHFVTRLTPMGDKYKEEGSGANKISTTIYGGLVESFSTISCIVR